jgi:hypothetical protein
MFDGLTWTGLLAQWVQFAQASLAIPDEQDGPRWRTCVPAVINLQAVTFALADLDQLAVDERALGLDKAEMLIEHNTRIIRTAWADATLTPMLRELCDDARAALRAALARHHQSPSSDS